MRELLPLSLLGGLLGLDVVCFPQMMISRPLVGATLAGAFVGDTTTGMLVGVTLELIALATLPFALITVASALTAIGAAFLIERWGRRVAFCVGGLSCTAGGALSMSSR